MYVNAVMIDGFDREGLVTFRISKHLEGDFLDLKVEKQFTRSSTVKLQTHNLPCRFIEIIISQKHPLSQNYSVKQIRVKAVSGSEIKDYFGEDYLAVLDPLYLWI